MWLNKIKGEKLKVEGSKYKVKSRHLNVGYGYLWIF